MQQAYRALRVVAEAQTIRIVLSPHPGELMLRELSAACATFDKQGSSGDNTEKKPGFSEMVARAKWEAWNNLKGTSQDDAMQQYIDLIADLS